jgi:mono/diheme cytochrome c family protein
MEAPMRKGVLGAAIFGAVIAVAAAAAPKKQPTVSFSEDVFPVLQIRCGACHAPGGEGFEASGLDLRSYDGLMKGTKFGPIVVAGEPATSNLMVLLDGRADKSLQMPHGKKKLTTCDRDLIRAWIREGAQNN